MSRCKRPAVPVAQFRRLGGAKKNAAGVLGYSFQIPLSSYANGFSVTRALAPWPVRQPAVMVCEPCDLPAGHEFRDADRAAMDVLGDRWVTDGEPSILYTHSVCGAGITQQTVSRKALTASRVD